MNALDFGQLLPLLAIAVTAGIFGGILAGLLGVGVCQAADICYSYAVFTGSGLLPFV